nr:MAG TPA: hypothetical protein [Caudoviricetes sp.]
MRKTTNFELNIAEGSDRYNHLTVDNPNYEKIDATMKENEDNAVQTATELKSGTVHAITRNKPNASMFRFVATSDYTSGETFTVDGQQVTALLPNGATLGTGAYHINANVLCCLVGTNMTVYTIGVAENVDASTLDGHGVDYFATATDLNDVRQTATSAGVVANAAQQNVNEFKSVLCNLTTNWSTNAPYSQSVVIAGVTSSFIAGTPVGVGGDTSAESLQKMATNVSSITAIVSDNGTLTFYCANNKPTESFSVRVPNMVMKG